MTELYADVLIPLPLYDKFTYAVPPGLRNSVEPGKRVTVSFGKKKLYAALVIALHGTKPDGIRLKEIMSVIDENPVINKENLRLWQWIADYYCCTSGEVMRAALPSGLKMESQTKFTAALQEDWGRLNEEEISLLVKMKDKSHSVEEIQKIAGHSFSFKVMNNLIGQGFLNVTEELRQVYRPRYLDFVSLSTAIAGTEDVGRVAASLSSAKKQKALFDHFLKLSGGFSPGNCSMILKSTLLNGTEFTANVLKGLVTKNILMTVKKEVPRMEADQVNQTGLNILNNWQQEALNEIRDLFRSRDIVLLHGITASGKTEIYIHLIQEQLAAGRQALFLVPEIAITTQIIIRLKKAFGKNVGIYHSKLNDHERVEIWNRVLSFRDHAPDSYQIILGARSAVFLPFSKLGLVIADEEHENSYKQYDPAPRYNARDLAAVLSQICHARVILGSATPSIESYLNALTGKYGLVKIGKRHNDVESPEILISDLRQAYKKKLMKSMFTPELFDHINTALRDHEQVILFQNRRGYAPYVECMDCGWIPRCRSCDVSLTYHRHIGRLTCHYCGDSQIYPGSCPECRSVEIKTRGFGTEKIEAELKKLFREARIERMDLDTTHSKKSFEKIIRSLETKKTDILVGTQMVTKGLDFDNVSLVGILNADNLINFPDFRSYERAFQLLSQVSGRAGRRKKRGMVVIQTTQPAHPVIEAVKHQDFQSFYKSQLAERKIFNYPPYARLIRIVVKHKNTDKASRIARQLAEVLANEKKMVVLGPHPPLISRIQLWFLEEIRIKLPKSQDVPGLKKFISESVELIKGLPDNSGAMINVDVDPM